MDISIFLGANATLHLGYFLFTFSITALIVRRYYIRHQIIHRRKLIAYFPGWNEKIKYDKKRKYLEKKRQKEFYKEEKRRLIEKGLISRF